MSEIQKEKAAVPKGFLDAYHHVAEKSSGTLSLAVIQCLVTAACAVKAAKISGIESVILSVVAVVSFAGFFACACVIAGVILKQNICSRPAKLAMLVMFLPVFTGVLLTALITLKSL